MRSPLVAPRPVAEWVQLRGWVLTAARAAWLVFAALMLTTAIAGMRATYLYKTPPPGLEQLGLSPEFFHVYRSVLEVVFLLLPFFGVAFIIFWRKSDEWMALFVAFFLMIFAANWLCEPSRMPGWEGWLKGVDWLAWTSFLNFFLIFPTGGYVPRWARAVGFGVPAWNLLQSFLPVPQPIIFIEWLSTLGFVGVVQIYRYRSASGSLHRQQTKWVAFGFTITFLALVGSTLLPTVFPTLQQPGRSGALFALVDTLVNGLLFLPIPICVGVAVLRYRLWAIDPLLNRTLVYTLLSTCVIGIYALTVGGLGALFRTGDNFLIALLATSLVAIAFQPLRERLQRLINRFLYGERDEPFAVLSKLSQRLEGSLEPAAVLPSITETVAQTLRLPYAALALRDGDQERVVTAYGTPVEATSALPLVYQNETVGDLILGLRAAREPFSRSEEKLLSTIARQASVAAYAVRLTADLQRSREALVLAREEERRRLRRDLHDGLGPALAGLTLKIEAARHLLTSDPKAAEAQLVALSEQTQNTVADVRRLVYGLRPPSLDDLGLVPALREQAAQYEGQGLNVTVQAPEPMPPLPAAVEVAVYRIVQEALVNVARHAKAKHCGVLLSIKEGLTLEVNDDGTGIPKNFRRGVGLTSMRERAEELGGTFDLSSDKGTHLVVNLPLAQERHG